MASKLRAKNRRSTRPRRHLSVDSSSVKPGAASPGEEPAADTTATPSSPGKNPIPIVILVFGLPMVLVIVGMLLMKS